MQENEIKNPGPTPPDIWHDDDDEYAETPQESPAPAPPPEQPSAAPKPVPAPPQTAPVKRQEPAGRALAKTAPPSQPALAIAVRRPTEVLADALKMDAAMVRSIIISQCFAGWQERPTEQHLATYCAVAAALIRRAPGFDPIQGGMLYAYPTSNGGIQPMLGPDGVSALLNAIPGAWFKTESEILPDGEISATATIEIPGKKPFTKTVFLSEWKTYDKQGQAKPKWNRPRFSLEQVALKQAARMVIPGIPADEPDGPIEREAEMVSAPQQGSKSERLASTLRARQNESEAGK